MSARQHNQKQMSLPTLVLQTLHKALLETGHKTICCKQNGCVFDVENVHSKALLADNAKI